MTATISYDALLAFSSQVFEGAGAGQAEAAIVAEHLVLASLLGYDTHGVMRIPEYVEDVRKGVIKPAHPSRITPKMDRQRSSIVDGISARSADVAIDVAVAKARNLGPRPSWPVTATTPAD